MGHPSSIAARSAATCAALLLAGCCSAKQERTREVLDAVQQDRLTFGSNADSIGVFRQSIEDSKEARELVSFGQCSAEIAADRVRQGPSKVSDDTACLCAITIKSTASAHATVRRGTSMVNPRSCMRHLPLQSEVA